MEYIALLKKVGIIAAVIITIVIIIWIVLYFIRQTQTDSFVKKHGGVPEGYDGGWWLGTIVSDIKVLSQFETVVE